MTFNLMTFDFQLHSRFQADFHFWSNQNSGQSMEKNPHRRHGQKCINARIIGKFFSYDLQLLETNTINSHDSYLERQNHAQDSKRDEKDIKSLICCRISRQMYMYFWGSINDDQEHSIQNKDHRSFGIRKKNSQGLVSHASKFEVRRSIQKIYQHIHRLGCSQTYTSEDIVAKNDLDHFFYTYYKGENSQQSDNSHNDIEYQIFRHL